MVSGKKQTLLFTIVSRISVRRKQTEEVNGKCGTFLTIRLLRRKALFLIVRFHAVCQAAARQAENIAA
jgi:hypothetical protein